MVQLGFYDFSQRYEGLHAKDPLVMLAQLIVWEDFRTPLRHARESSARRRASARAGRAASRGTR